MLDAWLGTNCTVLQFRKNRNNNRNIRLVHTPNLGSICHALGITLFALQGMHKQQEDIFKQPFHCLCAWVCLCLTPSPSVRQSVCLSTWRWAYGAHRFNFSDYFSTFWCQPPSHPATQLPKCRPFQSHQPCLYVLPFSPNFYIDWSIFVLSAFARLGPCGFRIWIWIWIWLWLWLWLCLPFRHMQNKQEREVSRRGVFILRRRCK